MHRHPKSALHLREAKEELFIMEKKTITLNSEKNTRLDAYLLGTGGEFREVTSRPAVLVIPGGGYDFCSDREADPVAMGYLKAGFDAFVLYYSVAADKAWPAPLDDYEEAMKLIRGHAEEWHVIPDQIAVCGFSAGGHLAGAAATMSINRPNAAILGYAVLGDDVKGYNVTAPDTIGEVDGDTPACFLFHARNDGVVPVMNSIRFMEALCDKGISFESHIYAYGGHGFSTADPSIQAEGSVCPRALEWLDDSIAWLKELFGSFGPEGRTKPRFKRLLNNDNEAMLSVDCTFGRVLGNPRGREVLSAFVEKYLAFTSLEPSAQKMVPPSTMVVREALSFEKIPDEAIAALNQELQTIPNI